MKNILLSSLALFVFQIGMAQEILSLEKAIALTLENNYDIKISKNNEEIAANNKSILNTGFLPTISTGASGNYSLSDNFTKLNNGTERTNTGLGGVGYNANVNLSYTIFNGLGRMYNLKKFKEQFKLSQIQTEFVVENTLFQVAQQYYMVAQQYQTIQNFKKSLKFSSDRLLKAQYDFEYGQNTKLDILNAEIDFNNDSINLMNSTVQPSNAKLILNQLMGMDMNYNYVTETSVNFNPEINEQILLEKAQENNKLLNQKEKNLLLNEYDIKIAKSNWLPKLNVNGSYAFNNSNNDNIEVLNGPTGIDYTNIHGPSAQLSLTWNLFDGGKTMTNIQNSKILLENNKTDLASEKLKLERDIKTAYLSYQNTIAVLTIQTKNLETNKANFQRTEEKYKNGQINSIFFRQAQLNLLNAENSINIARFNAKIAELNLLRLSGELIQ